MTYTSTRLDGTTVDYLSPAETARLIRTALRDAFPDGRFRVRARSYSGGGAVDVAYVDGPPREAVDAVVDAFRGKDFDGTIDLEVSVCRYIDAAGRVVGTQTVGTVGSHGYLPAIDDKVPGARLVHTGVYTHVERILSADARARIDSFIRDRYGVSSAVYAPPGAYRHAEADLGTLPFGGLPAR